MARWGGAPRRASLSLSLPFSIDAAWVEGHALTYYILCMVAHGPVLLLCIAGGRGRAQYLRDLAPPAPRAHDRATADRARGCVAALVQYLSGCRVQATALHCRVQESAPRASIHGARR